ncbi:MAG TPA: short-chain dehydrogenase, partial [Methylophilaceae bacterium]|nr:short-chain dehydrogenase [Methylophilaceae bacterium]
IDVSTSVNGLRRVIEQLTLEESGKMIGYDGKVVNW